MIIIIKHTPTYPGKPLNVQTHTGTHPPHAEISESRLFGLHLHQIPSINHTQKNGRVSTKIKKKQKEGWVECSKKKKKTRPIKHTTPKHNPCFDKEEILRREIKKKKKARKKSPDQQP